MAELKNKAKAAMDAGDFATATSISAQLEKLSSEAKGSTYDIFSKFSFFE